MKVGVIGSGVQAEARVRAVQSVPCAELVDVLEEVPLAPVLAGPGVGAVSTLGRFLAELDVAFVAAPTADHFGVAEAATKQGVHVFLEWPPAVSVRECGAIVRLAEEASVEVGVSRPLRFHPALACLPAGWSASIILLRQEAAETAPASWQPRLADAVDLCCALARSSSVQRIDAEAVRGEGAWPEAVAFGLRFHNGAYAQVSLRCGAAVPGDSLYIAGPGVRVESDLAGTWLRATTSRGGAENVGAARAFVPLGSDHPPPFVAETQAFLHALAERRPAPVSVLDGLHTMRLVERLMGRLR